MRKIVFLILFITSLGQLLWAAPITKEKALRRALSFLQSSDGQDRKTFGLSSLSSVPEEVLQSSLVNYKNNPFYVFQDKESFVIVSGDDTMPAVVGYSFSGSFTSSSMPPALKAYLEAYAAHIAEMQVTPELLKLPTQKITVEPIAPLIKTRWDQSTPYNDLCPQELLTGRRCVTGCVATAYAQLMYYHQWPERGIGSNSYSDKKAGWVNADFSRSIYDWGNMLTEYVSGSYTKEQSDAVALLMRDAGIAINMMYGSSMSAAYPFDVPYALVNYFGYSKSTRFVNRDWYSTTEWIDLIVRELKAGRPMMYNGSSSGMGHVFVCDGIDTEGKLHINWGWGGAYDGYFDMNVMKPDGLGVGGGAGSYAFEQGLVLGIQPARGDDTASDFQHVVAYGGTYVTGNVNKLTRQRLPFYLSAVYNFSSRSLNDVMFAVAIHQEVDDKLLEIFPPALVGGAFKHGLNGGKSVPLEITIPDSYADGIYNLKFIFKEQKTTEWLPLIVPRQYRGEWRIKLEGQNVTILDPVYDCSFEQILTNAAVSDKWVFQGYPASLKFTVKTQKPSNTQHVLYAGLFPKGREDMYLSTDSLNVILFDSATVTFNLPISTEVPVGKYKIGILEKVNGKYNMFDQHYQGEIEILDRKAKSTLFFENFNLSTFRKFTCIDNDRNTPSKNFAEFGFTDNTAWKILGIWENNLSFSHSGYKPVGTSDDWMITKAITVPDDVQYVFLSWNDILVDDVNYSAGEYSVYVSTTGNQISDFIESPVYFSQLEVLNDYQLHQIQLEGCRGKTIYVAFRNESKNKNMVGIDDIHVFTYGKRSTLKGDANGDGMLDKIDLELIERYICGALSKLDEFALSDVNEDGVVDIADLQMVNVLLNDWKPTVSDIGEGTYSVKGNDWEFTSSSAIGAFQLTVEGEFVFSDVLLPNGQLDKFDSYCFLNEKTGKTTCAFYSLIKEGFAINEPIVLFSGSNLVVTDMKFVDMCGKHILMKGDDSVSIVSADISWNRDYILVEEKLVVKGALQLVVFDLSGRLMVTVQGEECNLDEFSSGTYVVVAKTQDGIKRLKIVH